VTPRFSARRMVKQYAEDVYVKAMERRDSHQSEVDSRKSSP